MTQKSLLVLLCTLVVLGVPAMAQTSAAMSSEDNVRTVIRQFEEGLNQRSVAKIQSVVANDVVVLENGHRNDGWIDFRDNHLIPEMKEPALASRSELIKIKTSREMAWAYTKTEIKLTDKNGGRAVGLLWSVYIIEKRAGEWKIVLLDWSMRAPKPQQK